MKFESLIVVSALKGQLTFHSVMKDLRGRLGSPRLRDFRLDPCPGYQIVKSC
jgi:hypothetical protein